MEPRSQIEERTDVELLPAYLRYGAAVLVTGLALLLTVLLSRFHPSAETPAFLLAVALAAWWGGTGDRRDPALGDVPRPLRISRKNPAVVTPARLRRDGLVSGLVGGDRGIGKPAIARHARVGGQRSCAASIC